MLSLPKSIIFMIFYFFISISILCSTTTQCYASSLANRFTSYHLSSAVHSSMVHELCHLHTSRVHNSFGIYRFLCVLHRVIHYVFATSVRYNLPPLASYHFVIFFFSIIVIFYLFILLLLLFLLLLLLFLLFLLL